MWRLISLVYFILAVNEVENHGIRIPLIRQKTPREAAMNSPNMEHHGVYLNWLKKPHHKNATNGTDSIALYRFLDNCRGLRGKLNQLYRETLNSDYDILCLTETWLTAGICDGEILDQSLYNIYRCDRNPNITNKNRGGGVLMASEFYGIVQIGQRGQPFNMIFDTTWAISWVLSNDCSWRTIGCWFHNKYKHAESSTYVANGTKYVANEGSFNLTGYYSNDTFSIAHSRVNGQIFVEMTSVPYMFLFSKADGVMGLGFNNEGNNPFFYNLLKNKSIAEPLFSVYLNRDRQSPRGGNLLLGFIDEKHIHQTIGPDGKPVKEPITYLPINPEYGYWEFTMDRIQLDITSKNKTYPYCINGCKAMPDTTNTVIIGPTKDIEAMHALMGASYLAFGRYHVKCDTVNKLPPIEFILAGKSFVLKGEHYIQKMSYNSFTICVSAFVAPSAVTEQNYWILGGAFLAHYYSIYDIGNTRIGFVTAA